MVPNRMIAAIIFNQTDIPIEKMYSLSFELTRVQLRVDLGQGERMHHLAKNVERCKYQVVMINSKLYSMKTSLI